MSKDTVVGGSGSRLRPFRDPLFSQERDRVLELCDGMLSAFVWAFAVLIVVGWLGPTYLAQYGFAAWKGAVVIGLAVFVMLKVLGSYERRALERP